MGIEPLADTYTMTLDRPICTLLLPFMKRIFLHIVPKSSVKLTYTVNTYCLDQKNLQSGSIVVAARYAELIGIVAPEDQESKQTHLKSIKPGRGLFKVNAGDDYE